MKSPGHQKWPDHAVREEHLAQSVRVTIDGRTVADSSDVIKVDEDGNPPRYYFPRRDVRMDLLERADATTKCPFKGTAKYFDLALDGKKVEQAVWTYEDPFEEHLALKDRVAFWEENIPGIEIKA